MHCYARLFTIMLIIAIIAIILFYLNSDNGLCFWPPPGRVAGATVIHWRPTRTRSRRDRRPSRDGPWLAGVPVTRPRVTSGMITITRPG
jgi:hypothetical protein